MDILIKYVYERTGTILYKIKYKTNAFYIFIENY